jgi:N-acetyl-alpha-D-glucosaminyl L-malate synthase BshA
MVAPRRMPIVTTLHGTDITLVGVQPSFREIVRFSIDQSDRVTAVSDFLRRKTNESFQVETPIDRIPNFVDTEQFRSRRDEGCPVFCVEEGRKVVLHASNFRPVKNIPAVVRTFAAINERIPSDLLLVGDGPELWQAKELARNLEIEPVVHFLGVRDDLEELLGRADLYLLPSEHESFGLSALEAMSSEVPVICTDRGGTGEVMVHGESGFLVDPHDVEEMSRIGIELLADPARHGEVGQAARQRVLENFATEVVVDRYEDLYEDLLAGEPGPGRPA